MSILDITRKHRSAACTMKNISHKTSGRGIARNRGLFASYATVTLHDGWLSSPMWYTDCLRIGQNWNGDNPAPITECSYYNDDNLYLSKFFPKYNFFETCRRDLGEVFIYRTNNN